MIVSPSQHILVQSFFSGSSLDIVAHSLLSNLGTPDSSFVFGCSIRLVAYAFVQEMLELLLCAETGAVNLRGTGPSGGRVRTAVPVCFPLGRADDTIVMGIFTSSEGCCQAPSPSNRSVAVDHCPFDPAP